MNEYYLVIEFVFEVKSKLPFKKFRFPVQNFPFKCGLRIRNNGDKVFPGAILKNFVVRPTDQSINLFHDFPGEFKIGELNPSDEITLWFGELNTFLEGMVWVACDVSQLTPTDKITTYQKERNTNQVILYNRPNSWGVEEFIQSQSQVQTARTNFLLVVLTLLIFLEGLWGIKSIVISVLNLLSKILLFLSELVRI
ncbi:MAG: hypothetical protein A3C03_00080 [Candidatus Colwellbacteria bacterium RIFCSPHIGHO2_02_FULL_45_17]|uniref:Uncharacterized protein n=2 Tax=Candidatus Colwelliibacteriota TaxID=1817904 RepID=A0A1G1ZDC2_9BACT|nr:MAG: hypothetical protein A3C03_00080 [Candidatus Colwellbacteria bacterium RIFCSPHIGHO2_02_FULL_45_17]OGY61040.1 MAG: hypothetical protein A3I33_01315 [Candidatus Colwellbacteria bacterium RIFCSPLOWO2_02_FULL_45_11]OGY62612.1 MAG: hypothetical protein A3G58_00325 [Candidatus Colwellbacteria bacterium RIFCSPLOWO2_12_FULL_46_17]